MYYDGYHYWGMHMVWWIVWLVFIFWIFVLPYDIPGQRSKKDGPLELLKKRFATGQINKEEYQEKKKVLETV
jgi:putative membrane protein